MRRWEGEKKTTKKFSFPPRNARGEGKGDREKKLILNLQRSPENLGFLVKS